MNLKKECKQASKRAEKLQYGVGRFMTKSQQQGGSLGAFCVERKNIRDIHIFLSNKKSSHICVSFNLSW